MINYNQPWGIDPSLALHKDFFDSRDRKWMDFQFDRHPYPFEIQQ